MIRLLASFLYWYYYFLFCNFDCCAATPPSSEHKDHCDISSHFSPIFNLKSSHLMNRCSTTSSQNAVACAFVPNKYAHHIRLGQHVKNKKILPVFSYLPLVNSAAPSRPSNSHPSLTGKTYRTRTCTSCPRTAINQPPCKHKPTNLSM
jgi:hypothetical protein